MSTEHFKKALELAKKNRGKNQPAQTLIRPRTKSWNRNNHRQTVDQTTDDIVNIQYQFTKIYETQPEILRENRIIAGFHDDPRSTPFRILRTQIHQALKENHWNTLAITAPHSRAGKTFVSANLAISMSLMANQTVLLVDLDLRNPSIHKYFGLETEYGIYDYLTNDVSLQQIMINPGLERLVLLPGSTPTRTSSELLATRKAQELLDEIRTRYPTRIIIYDLPPLIGMDDAMVVLPKIESSLLVVEANRTTADDVTKSLKILEDSNLLGTVFNKADDAEIVQYGY